MTIRITSEQTAQTIKAALQTAQKRAQKEYAGYQISGRALTAEEMAHCEDLTICLNHIHAAVKALGRIEG